MPDLTERNVERIAARAVAAKTYDTRDVRIFGYAKRSRDGLGNRSLTSNSFTDIPTSVIVDDPDFRITGGVYNVAHSGWYYARASLRYEDIAGQDTVLALWFKRNGVSWEPGSTARLAPAANSLTLIGWSFLWLDQGDTLGLQAYYFGDASSPKVMGTGQTHLSAWLGGVA